MLFILFCLLATSTLLSQQNNERIKLYQEKLNLFKRMHTDYEPLAILMEQVIKGLSYNQSQDILKINIALKNKQLSSNNRLSITKQSLPQMKKIAKIHQLTELFEGLEEIEEDSPFLPLLDVI